jgi:hypothetical protein
MIHPDHLIFIDEVGSNNLQAKDGQEGGQTYLCSVDGRPQITAPNGEPLLCIITFAAKSMKREWIAGFDPFAEWIGNEDNFRKNCGDDKPFPFSPTCFLRANRFLAFAATLKVVALMKKRFMIAPLDCVRSSFWMVMVANLISNSWNILTVKKQSGM